jgi:probable HAF family extracellular repeat protein
LGGLETYFYDINNQNQIARPPHLRARSHPPALCRPGFHQPPTGFGRRHRYANGINNKGAIVGQLDSDGLNTRTVNTAALWDKGADGQYKLTNLGTFGAEQAIARDINDAGQIIGWTVAGTGATATSSPFLLQDGQKINLGSFGGANGQAPPPEERRRCRRAVAAPVAHLESPAVPAFPMRRCSPSA